MKCILVVVTDVYKPVVCMMVVDVDGKLFELVEVVVVVEGVVVVVLVEIVVVVVVVLVEIVVVVVVVNESQLR